MFYFLFSSRFKRDVLEEVQQEFLVTKTIQEVEASREIDVNFVGVFISGEDKVSQFSWISTQFPVATLMFSLFSAPIWVLWASDGVSPEEWADDFHGDLRHGKFDFLPGKFWWIEGRWRCENPAKIYWHIWFRPHDFLQLNDCLQWFWSASCVTKRRWHCRASAGSDSWSRILHAIAFEWKLTQLVCDWLTLFDKVFYIEQHVKVWQRALLIVFAFLRVGTIVGSFSCTERKKTLWFWQI